MRQTQMDIFINIFNIHNFFINIFFFPVFKKIFYLLHLMMISWPVLALVILWIIYAFGLSSTLTSLVPQVSYALCRSLSFNQIYVLSFT